MTVGNRVSTGMPGFDSVIDLLRLGDNVVWQVQSVEHYRDVVGPFIRQARADGRRLIYMRFGSHPPLLEPGAADAVYQIDAAKGFERFTTEIYETIEGEGRLAFYVFDCLTDLLQFWQSDLMIGNFFRVTCPFLFQLDTIAYFALLQGAHTYDTIARIRETTQLLLNLYRIDGAMYIHPLKVWERYSPTMFFPHQIRDSEAVSITASAQAAELFSNLEGSRDAQDYWTVTLEQARQTLEARTEVEQIQARDMLLERMIGREERIRELCRRYFSLRHLLRIADREIGTGYIGGKSVGMLLARRILWTECGEMLRSRWESHDSYYLGSDIFYTYIVQNGWWQLRMKQKTEEGYFTLAPQLKENLLRGQFPTRLREQFMQMLEYFGQSPIIVRSSSLLEDNFGNAFAGKYDSVFCANQGSPEDRYAAFEQAVRRVYASTMNPDALAYRKNRGLTDRDEQMAILVQRVSGDHYGDLFFPHVAGVGNSSNLYVWDREMDPDAGMLRLVFGLGTRAVDRISGDYARIVPLDDPGKSPPVNYGEERKFSQHRVDVLNLRENRHCDLLLEDLLNRDIRADQSLFFSVDFAAYRRLQELGRTGPAPRILDFRKLLAETDFPALLKHVLSTLETAYRYPVDVEFTCNFIDGDQPRFNLLQCRPLQTRGLGKTVEAPQPPPDRVLLETHGGFMGGNTMLPLEYAAVVRAPEYLALPEQEKYKVARLIGALNERLKEHSTMLIGPGRWGTTTPSLGVPVHFTELCHMNAICEVSYRQAGMTPELSFGSHFFQDMVESGIFYAAVYDGEEGLTFRLNRLLESPNRLPDLAEAEPHLASVVHVTQLPGLTLYSNIRTQQVLCFQE